MQRFLEIKKQFIDLLCNPQSTSHDLDNFVNDSNKSLLYYPLEGNESALSLSLKYNPGLISRLIHLGGLRIIFNPKIKIEEKSYSFIKLCKHFPQVKIFLEANEITFNELTEKNLLQALEPLLLLDSNFLDKRAKAVH
jgi:hypothetical protein